MGAGGEFIAKTRADNARWSAADRIADWMSEHGGGLAECARALGIPYESAKTTWKRIRKRLGWQAR